MSVDVASRALPACSLFQPWASLIAIGRKQIETRSWPAPRDRWGQPIAIHATARITMEHLEVVDRNDCRALEFAGHATFDQRRLVGDRQPATAYLGGLPTRAVVAVAMLSECRRVPLDEDRHLFDERLEHEGYNTERECRLGDVRPGRWLWLLKDVVRLTHPVLERGHQRLWPVSPEALFAIGQQLRDAAPWAPR